MSSAREREVSSADLPALGSGVGRRALLARLQVTAVQRGVREVVLDSDEDGGSPWFSNRVLGLPTGFQEGVIVGGEGASAVHQALALAGARGAALFSWSSPAHDDMAPPMAPHVVHHCRAWTVVRTVQRLREVLVLGPTFEDTLGSMGGHTRRNIRKARREADASGFSWTFSATDPLLEEASRARLAAVTQPHRISRSRVRRLDAYAASGGRPFYMVLRAGDGRTVSYACGYFAEKQGAYLLYQLNDPTWNAVGPSLMLRAFLLERLIELGVREVFFVHGCSGVLRNACRPVMVDHLWGVRRSLAGLLGAGVISVAKYGSFSGRSAAQALAAQCPFLGTRMSFGAAPGGWNARRAASASRTGRS